MTDPLILAYLAGIIDGEGSVGFAHRGPASGCRRFFYIQVVMTDKPIMDLFVETFGGKLHQRNLVGRLGTKPQWAWQARGNPAWDIYYQLEPYLRLKRWKQEPR